MLWINRATGAALIALTVPFWQLSAEYPEMAQLFPRTMLVVIGCFAAVMVVRSFIPAVAPVNEGEGVRTVPALRRPLIVFALLLAAIVSSQYVGFFTAMALMAALLVPALGLKHWGWYALACAIVMLFVYVLFVLFLKVPLAPRLPGF